MPELPDVELYVSKLREKLVGHKLTAFKALNLFVLRTVDPSPSELVDREIIGISRIGKKIALHFEGDLYLVIHLMIAGRLRWFDNPEAIIGGKLAVAALTFDNGRLILTEAGSKKRASISVLSGAESIESQHPGGVEVLDCTLEEFTAALARESHTVKRSLTSPHLFSGVGNAYSDEILHAAKISPVKLTKSLTPEEIKRLYVATREVLTTWSDRLKKQFEGKFPGAGEITAFRPDFAVHGKFGKPCPFCGKPVQRIVYADNECNYCAVCQNEGRILADRSMSRLLKDDWPRSFDN